MIFIELDAFVTFQESFESPEPKFETFETKSTHFKNILGSRAAVVGLSRSGYFRLNIPFYKSKSMQFSFYMVDWEKEVPLDTLFTIHIASLYFYETQKVPYAQTTPVSWFLQQDPRTGQVKAGFISQPSDTVIMAPVNLDSYNTVNLIYEIQDRTWKGKITVNKTYTGTFSRPLPDGDVVHFTCGNMGYTGRFKGKRYLSVDNVICSDRTEEMSFMVPAFSLAVVDTSRIGVRVEPQIQDSMVSIEVSDNPNFIHPLLSRTLPVDQSSPFINGFPLLPGNYHVRISANKKNRLKTDFSPAKQIKITYKRKNDSLRIIHALIEDEFTGAPAEELVPGQWYVFRSSLSTIQDCFALFWLHHASFTYGGVHNKGGYFDRERNYIFNLSLTKDPWLYGSREDIKGRSIRVDGNRYLYLDDRDNFFKQDTNSKTVHFRFKLLKEALPGNWMLSGYIEEDIDSRSYLFARPIRVLSDREISLRQIAESRKVRFRILAAVAGLILTGCLAVSFIAYRRKRFKTQPENILTLLSRGEIFIRVKDHKYRHVVARAQKFIFEQLNQEISLSDVAKDQNRSSTWIAQVFKKATGFTVVRFINRVKIERAKEYLSKGHSITDTAMQVGFASHEHFRRVFKEQTRMTPTEFKKSLAG